MSRRPFSGIGTVVGLLAIWGSASWALWVLATPLAAEERQIREADRVLYHRATARTPARFALKGGERLLKLISHGLVRGGAPPDRRLRYALEITLRDPAGEARYQATLHAVSRRSLAAEAGAPNAFLLDSRDDVYDDRVTIFELPVSVPVESTLEVRAPGQAEAVLLRVYADEALDLVHRKAFDWWVGRAEGDRRWSRRPGRGAGRVVYYTGNRTPFVEAEARPRQPIDAHRALALQVEGPASLWVRVWPPEEGPVGTAVTLSDPGGGLEGRYPVPPPGGLLQRRLEVPAGIHSLHLRADGPARVGVDAAEAAVRFGDVAPVHHRGRALMLPDERRIRVFRAGPAGAVHYPLEPGEAGRAMRLLARAAEDPGPRTLRLELRDASDEPLEVMEHDLESPRAPFERLQDAAGQLLGVGEPVTLHVSAPAAARTLVVAADAPVVLQGQVHLPAPPEAPTLGPPYDRWAASALRWRYAPLLSHDWHTVDPTNREQLRSAGADPLLIAQVRLEPIAARPPPERPRQFRTLVPLGRPVAQLILERTASGAWSDGAWSEVPLDRPWALTEGARPDPRLIFWLPEATPGGVLSVHGLGAREPIPLGSSGGATRLAGLGPGRPIRLAAEGARRAPRVFVDRPVAGAPIVQRRRVYPLSGRGVVLSVPHREGRATVLNAMIYAPGVAADAGVTLVSQIDGGAPRRAGRLGDRRLTPGTRRAALPEARTRQRPALLYQDGQAVGPPRVIAVVLGPDLASGHHRVHVRAEGGRWIWGRFFMAGAPRQVSDAWHWRRRAEAP